ncbi:hypothetical protein [Ralstonia insidiosa]|uniref:hypothetical protein n=1 Tax=Ralstonia insidiosa TaxID=190721 RepID=UPI001EE62301|nr:hypothetical protein [Ralstonia insidiosa]
MGDRRARHRAMGFAAMRALRWLLLGCAGLVAGCSSVGPLTGAAAGVASGAVTANPAVAYGVAVTVNAATDASIKYATRKWAASEQDALATAVGRLSDGAPSLNWSLERLMGITKAHGKVVLVRTFTTPLATCREAILTVQDGDAPKTAPGYTIYACQNGNAWQWANAEPAVPRWGNLQ